MRNHSNVDLFRYVNDNCFHFLFASYKGGNYWRRLHGSKWSTSKEWQSPCWRNSQYVTRAPCGGGKSKNTPPTRRETETANRLTYRRVFMQIHTYIEGSLATRWEIIPRWREVNPIKVRMRNWSLEVLTFCFIGRQRYKVTYTLPIIIKYNYENLKSYLRKYNMLKGCKVLLVT